MRSSSENSLGLDAILAIAIRTDLILRMPNLTVL